MAALTIQPVVQAGVVVTFATAGVTNDTMPCGDHNVLRAKNTSGGSLNVIVAGNVPCSQGFTHNTTVAVAAGAEESIGPIAAARYGDSTGTATITYSGVGFTVAAVQA